MMEKEKAPMKMKREDVIRIEAYSLILLKVATRLRQGNHLAGLCYCFKLWQEIYCSRGITMFSVCRLKERIQSLRNFRDK